MILQIKNYSVVMIDYFPLGSSADEGGDEVVNLVDGGFQVVVDDGVVKL